MVRKLTEPALQDPSGQMYNTECRLSSPMMNKTVKCLGTGIVSHHRLGFPLRPGCAAYDCGARPAYMALVFSHLTRCTEGVTVALSAVVVVVTVVEGNHGGAKLGFDV
jgi:hypothetical protein